LRRSPHPAARCARVHPPLRGGISAVVARSLLIIDSVVMESRLIVPGICFGARSPCLFSALGKSEGGEAPTGAGAERRTRGPPCGRAGLLSGGDRRPKMRPETRAGAPFGASPRRLLAPRDRASGDGRGAFAPPDPGRFPRRSSVPRPALPGAAPRSWGGRRPEASRGHACEARPQAPHPAPLK
jgi:hypothetical protein